jgi:hypothetical protein
MPRISLSFLCLLALAGGLAPAKAVSNGLQPGSCWGTFDEDAKELNAGNATEILCVDKLGHASIREADIYGTGIEGCNVVTLQQQGDKLRVDINYKHCKVEAPSHTMTCNAPSADGVYDCKDLVDDPTADKNGSPAKLAPVTTDTH